jgi:hypothetical protein
LLAEDPFNLLGDHRPRSRAVAVPRLRDQSHSKRHFKKSPSAWPRYHAEKEGLLCWFENTNNPTWAGTSDQADMQDDDPMYEQLSCHKVTYIEEDIIKDPLNVFTNIEFAKEDIEDYIKNQIRKKQVP